MTSAHSGRAGSGYLSFLLNSTFRTLLPTFSLNSMNMPYLLLTYLVSGFQNHPKHLLFPGLWCWARHLYLHPRHIIILCDFNSHSIHSGPLRKTLRSFRDPASPSQSSPKAPWPLAGPGNLPESLSHLLPHLSTFPSL